MPNTVAGLDFHAKTSAALVKDYVALLSLNTPIKADHFTGVQINGIIHDLRRVSLLLSGTHVTPILQNLLDLTISHAYL